MLTTISIILAVIVFFFVYNKNKKANPELLDNPPSVKSEFVVDGPVAQVFKNILRFAQASDYAIELLREEKFELILNYSPKMGEQTNGTFFPIWVSSTEDGKAKIIVGAKDKSIAIKYEETRALEKLITKLKSFLLAN